MVKIDIISGFLGAGKTTLIKKLLEEALKGEKVVLIENEFGEIGVDGAFLKDAGIETKEMNSGCICCSLVGDFALSLKEVINTYSPEHILIEPSGVAKLSDVKKAVLDLNKEDNGIEVFLNSGIVVADASKCGMYIKNFGEFYRDQIENADIVILSRTGVVSKEKTEKAFGLLRELNADAAIVTTPWEQLDAKDILASISREDLGKELLAEEKNHGDGHHEHEHHGHEHHEHNHDEDCKCGCHGHGHHEHEHHGQGHHEHSHGDDCKCGCHGGHEHGHHEHGAHADDVFMSWGFETPRGYTSDDIKNILTRFKNENEFGTVLRAKGILPLLGGEDKSAWIYFDYVPDEINIREGKPDIIGKVCVIGAGLNEESLRGAFGNETR